MWMMHDLVMMFLSLFVNFIFGLMLLLAVLLMTYIFRGAIKSFFLMIWKAIHKRSYLDYIAREEAEKAFREGSK